MILGQIQDGSSVFVDANILIHHFAPDPIFGPPCRLFVARITGQDLAGFTSTHVLGNVAHRLMVFEAMTLLRWPVASIARRLKRHPLEIQKLTRFRQVVDNFANSGIQVLSISPQTVSAAVAISQNHGLLTGDALIIAVMQHNGLTNLVSNDADFDRVAGISRFAAA